MPPVTRSSGKGNKSLSAHCYRDQFRAPLTKVKASDSCTSSNAQFDDTGKRQKKNGNTSLEPCSPGVIKYVEEEPVSGPELSPKSGCSTASLKINAANSLDKLYAEQKGLHHMCLCSKSAKLQGFSKDLATGIEGFNLSNRKRKLNHEGFDIGGGKKKLNYVNKTKTSIEKILARQTREAKELQTLCDESKAKLEKYFKLECLEVNRSINSTEAVCTDKLKILEANHMKKLEELESEMGSCLKSMEAKHKNERKTMEKKVNCKMNERKSPEDYGLLDDLLTKAAEVIPAKSFTSSKNDLEEEDSQERGSVGVDVSLLHGPEEPHNDTAEDSSRAEVAENNADRKMDINSNDGDISKSLEENGLLDNLPTKAAEVIPAKGFTSLGNDLEEEDSEEHGSVGAHVPLLHGAEEPHNDAVENSSSVEPAENFADNKMDINTDGGELLKSLEENGLLDNLPTKATELISAKGFTSLGNDLEEEDSEEHGSVGAHVPLLHVHEESHNDAAENSSSAEAAENFADRMMAINGDGGYISKSKSAIQINYEARLFQNVGERALDSLDVQGIQSPLEVAAEQVEQIAAIRNDPPSEENPTLQQVADANEESTAVRMEQHDEAIQAQLPEILESLNSPSTMNPSVAVPVSQVLLFKSKSINSPSTMNPSVVPVSQVLLLNSESVNSPSTVNPSVAVLISQAILNPLNNEDVCAETSRDVLPSSDHYDGLPCNTSEQAACIHLPPDSTSPVDAAVSHPVELTQPCSTSCGAPNILLMESIQEDHMPLNRSVEGSPQLVLDAYPPLHNSNQFQSYMPQWSFPSSIPASQESNTLQNEYERLCGELNQVTRDRDDTVLLLKSECDKEMEELRGQLKMEYESMVHKAEASFLQKKRQFERYHLKLSMNIKLAEAFRSKNINLRTAPQQALGSGLTQQQF